MKRYFGIFNADSDTQVSSRAYSMQIQQNQNRVQTFNGRRPGY